VYELIPGRRDEGFHLRRVHEACVYFANSCSRDDFANVMGANAATREYDRFASARAFDHCSQLLDSFARCPRATGCKDPLNTQFNQRFKRADWIGETVERAVKCYRCCASSSQQSLQITLVQLAIGADNACHYSRRVSPANEPDVPGHPRDLPFRVDEVASAWTDHHLKWQSSRRTNRVNQLKAGRSAAVREIRAQLQSIHTGLFGGDSGFDRFDGGLDQNTIFSGDGAHGRRLSLA